MLIKFRDAYESLLDNPKGGAIDELIGVSRHYHSLLEEQGKVLRAGEVQRVIKRGYETLSIGAREGLDGWEPFREGGHRGTVKRAARVAIEDVKELIGAR